MAIESGSPSFGLWYDFRQELPAMQNYADFYAECLEEIEEGESLGFSDVWLSEHHFVDDGYLPSPLVVAGAIAARTRSIRIGTNVLLLPLHHPLRVAEDSVAVDLLSGGRFTLGVGSGYVQNEYEALGVDMGKRPSLMEEGVEVIRQCFTEGHTGYSGKRWNLKDLPFAPRPAGRLPIYLGGSTEPAFDRAARISDGFLASGLLSDFGSTYGSLREKLSEHGRAPGDFPFVASVTVFVHELPDRAWDLASPAIAYRTNRYAEWGSKPDGATPRRIRSDDLPREEYAVGTPEEVTESLIRLYREAPYDHLCSWGRLPGMTHEQALASMRLFAAEVAPAVREAVTAR